MKNILLVLMSSLFLLGCESKRNLTKEYAHDITWYAENYCGGKQNVETLSFSALVIKFECNDGRRVDIKIVNSL